MTNHNLMQQSLMAAAQEISGQVKLLDGREKGEMNDILNIPVTVDDYDFMNGSDGRYAVFTIKERPDQFFFGGSIFTTRITELDDKGFGEAVREFGLPVRFEKKKSKASNRFYTDAVLYPEEQATDDTAQ